MALKKGEIFGKDITTIIGQLRFPKLSKPEAYKEGKPRYGASLILPVNETTKQYVAAIDALAVKNFGKDAANVFKPYAFGPEIIASMKEPSEANKEFFKDKIRLSANAKEEKPPICKLANGNTIERRPGNSEDLDLIEQTFYAGALCRMVVTPCAFEMSKQSRGVTLLLKAIQFCVAGAPLGGADVNKSLSTDFDTSGLDAFQVVEADNTGLVEIDDVNI